MAEAFFGLVEVVEIDEVILVENEVVPFLVVVVVVAVIVVVAVVVVGGAVSSVESSVVHISCVVDGTVLKIKFKNKQ